MSFTELIWCCALARQIHGTDDAIRKTLHICRDRVSMQNRPLVSRLMRHPRVGEWLKLEMEVLDERSSK